MFLCGAVYAQPPQDWKARLEQSALQASEIAIARSSTVDIEMNWSGPGIHTRTYCKGVLVNEGRAVVTHQECLNAPYSNKGEYELSGAMLWFYDGYGIGGASMLPKRAGHFAYWDVSSFNVSVPAVSLDVCLGSTVFGWREVARGRDLSSLRFLFLGKTDWKIEELQPGNARFTLSYALRARVPGEPVFLNGKLVALNSGKDIQTPSVYPFNRPVFEAFTDRNGGEILQNL